MIGELKKYLLDIIYIVPYQLAPQSTVNNRKTNLNREKTWNAIL